MKLLVASAIGILALAATCHAGEPRPNKANRLTVPDETFGDIEILVQKSMPPQFVVQISRDMPTPGWKLDVDEVKVDADAHRIVARVTETGPGGMTSQVITPTPLRISVGTLDPGRYVLEIWTRRGTGARYQPAHATILVAGR